MYRYRRIIWYQEEVYENELVLFNKENKSCKIDYEYEFLVMKEIQKMYKI